MKPKNVYQVAVNGALGLGTNVRTVTNHVEVRRTTTKPVIWSVRHVQFDRATGELVRVLSDRDFKTEKAALKAHDSLLDEIRSKNDRRLVVREPKLKDGLLAHSHAKEISDAQLKTMKRAYPDFFAALQTPGASMEDRYAAYIIDCIRLDGEAPDDILRDALKKAARALSQVSPHDPVDAELAVNWQNHGYRGMLPNELALAINQKFGTQFSGAAVKKRRLRLGLTSDIPEGRPEAKRPQD